MDTVLAERQSRHRFFEPRLPYFLNDTLEKLSIEDADEIETALNRTFEACRILKIPLSHNFKRVYRYDDAYIMEDYKISALAHYLFIINCNPTNEKVARAQLYFVMHKSAHS